MQMCGPHSCEAIRHHEGADARNLALQKDLSVCASACNDAEKPGFRRRPKRFQVVLGPAPFVAESVWRAQEMGPDARKPSQRQTNVWLTAEGCFGGFRLSTNRSWAGVGSAKLEIYAGN